MVFELKERDAHLLGRLHVTEAARPPRKGKRGKGDGRPVRVSCAVRVAYMCLCAGIMRNWSVVQLIRGATLQKHVRELTAFVDCYEEFIEEVVAPYVASQYMCDELFFQAAPAMRISTPAPVRMLCVCMC